MRWLDALRDVVVVLRKGVAIEQQEFWSHLLTSILIGRHHDGANLCMSWQSLMTAAANLKSTRLDNIQWQPPPRSIFVPPEKLIQPDDGRWRT